MQLSSKKQPSGQEVTNNSKQTEALAKKSLIPRRRILPTPNSSTDPMSLNDGDYLLHIEVGDVSK